MERIAWRAFGLVAAAAAVAACPLLLRAQGDADRPRFEVASVKPNTSGDPGLRIDIQPGGRFIAANMPLKQLIRAAYTLQLYQIADAPGWVEGDRFDVNALAGRDIAITTPWTPGGRYAVAQLMLQSLLADRFQMVSHFEKRDSPTYALVVAGSADRTRDKLRPSAADCGNECGMRVTAGTLRARNVPLPQLAELLSQLVGRLVTDATGLTGTFDLDLRWTPDAAGAAADAPSIFTALDEQLGLRLESRRGPVDVLVIDRIEHPTPD